MRGTSEPPKGNPRPLGRGGGQRALKAINVLAELSTAESGRGREILD